MVNWENPERSLELQPGDQPTNSLYDHLRQSMGDFFRQFFGPSQSLFLKQNSGFAHKNLMNLFMTITVDLDDF